MRSVRDAVIRTFIKTVSGAEVPPAPAVEPECARESKPARHPHGAISIFGEPGDHTQRIPGRRREKRDSPIGGVDLDPIRCSHPE